MLADGNNGFLPTRGSFMLDFVVVAMLAVTIAMAISITLVKKLSKYGWHKAIQISFAVILLVAVLAFEVDMRFFTDWRELAEPSPFFESRVVHLALGVHLLFAIPAPIPLGCDHLAGDKAISQACCSQRIQCQSSPNCLGWHYRDVGHDTDGLALLLASLCGLSASVSQVVWSLKMGHDQRDVRGCNTADTRRLFQTRRLNTRKLLSRFGPEL